ncbi:hypothetical protein GLOIN_2v1484761 [Rhizophagus irregularis DAOM 181602=DAOM 197198]|uniref:Btb/poz domain-containing protein 19-like n=2 Tax=Rhizophagus irregularis TaxID=588596 RepID=A0A015N3Q4_RHIIW|nr:hypothetical protein GLOIN_2v1484761 [Rhizophagus irregularis DAOM 181602=DAOM 197198]EXX73733.1 hypothetical protein RirG_057640 [Rhizophagus irregularis DAOM 197198w]POG63323.1 hypothetical protein GLOIN_2v1484761 [Rhizophagus irregularis DAOM 181602=DAOM 197198]|eukprot:XP_025170189.1 hypothetical protein GLOIN_2v1484761 [Rhizophagus irregularis DAOM 181602=DAOM 197198]
MPFFLTDYEKLYETRIEYDVIIYVGEEPNIKEEHAHSYILCARSQYFQVAFSKIWAEKKDGKFIFKKPNISPQLFDIILRFFYCGKIELKNLQGLDIWNLLIAVDELNIQPLISHIQEFLIENGAEILHENPTDILDILEKFYQHETFENLWNLCLETICDDPKILFNSDKFINLEAPLLELLLKRDDFYIKEIVIWENLLKWCFARQNIKSDPEKWNKDDITNIGRLLHKFIPSIRFYNIESTDFFCKVYSYKEILPQDLIHELSEFHRVPNIKSKANLAPLRKLNLKLNIDSNLIESDHFILFASWIDKKDPSNYNRRKFPYDFKLLYRSSKDGFNAELFHRNCDDKGATIWVAKIQSSTQLIGGYNPLDWNGNDWKNTADSFLFSFTDGKIISTAKLGYVKDASRAVYCGKNFGPHMGDLNCAYYIRSPNKWNYYYSGDSYPNIGIPKDITVEDYEVFQIIKKSI